MTATQNDRTEQPNLADLLENIEYLATQARIASDDEHEGNLKLALNLLSNYASQAADLVNHW